METKLDPSIVSPAVRAMQAAAQVCNDVMGGTEVMRERLQYLPQEPMESDEAYSARVKRSVFFPAFKKAISTMVGRPFGEPVVLGEDVPPQIEPLAENIDQAGRDLDSFLRDTFRQTLVDGIGAILVDYTNTASLAAKLGKASLTLEDERANGVRPYWVHVPLSAWLGFRVELLNGVHRLTQFRYLETTEEPDGLFGVKKVQRVRVLEPGSVTVYVKQNDAWAIEPESSGSVTMPEIPLVPLYTGRMGFMCATPPFQDLAWLNVAHWQSSSDQRNILHKARVPVLFGKGLNKDSNGKVALGPNSMLLADSDGADLKWVEITGGAINAGKEDLETLKEEMARVAGEILSRVSGDKTATETDKEAEAGSSQLLAWVWTFQDAVEEALRLTAKWIGLTDGGSVRIATDWDEDQFGADMVAALTNAEGRILSRDSAIWTMKRNGFVPPDRTIEDEKALIQAESTSGLEPLMVKR